MNMQGAPQQGPGFEINFHVLHQDQITPHTFPARDSHDETFESCLAPVLPFETVERRVATNSPPHLRRDERPDPRWRQHKNHRENQQSTSACDPKPQQPPRPAAYRAPSLAECVMVETLR